jgi:hypothetical protein
VKLIRRAYYIEEAQHKKASDIAKTVRADKSEVVDLALLKGLAQIEVEEIGDVMRELSERRLRLAGKGSIKSASAKRRS